MSESTTEQGKSWVLDVFEQVREQYRETVPVETIFPWREDQGSHGLLTYSLAFAVGQDTHAIPFTEHELTAGAAPDNSEARFAIKKKLLLETFTALENHA